MFLGVVLVYLSPPYPNTVLIGADYLQLHSRRMQFCARGIVFSELFSPGVVPGRTPGYSFLVESPEFSVYTDAMLVLLTMDPMGPYSHAVAVTLSAVLAALFTYLFLR
jgi:hypothetical protein